MEKRKISKKKLIWLARQPSFAQTLEYWVKWMSENTDEWEIVDEEVPND